ncbi:MAG: polyprenyl synthetase family protein [Vicinamibacterales bacterium]
MSNARAEPSGSAASYLDELRGVIDTALTRALPAAGAAPTLLVDAMRYSLLAGGKRLRPALALAAADAIADARGESRSLARVLALPVAVALELIHTYSLIHDDLPAMDDDTLRRGRPTSHVVFGDGLAILAGDGLLTEAFAILAERESRVAPEGPHASEGRKLEALLVVARAAGPSGMVGGQAVDLHAAGKTPATVTEPRTLDAQALRDMHLRKTGALMQAACVAGGITAGAEREQVMALEQYGLEIGLAFQIVDDLLDVEGTEAVLGKTAGKDAAGGKPTYPALFGADESRRLAQACIDRAAAALAAARLTGGLAGIARLIIDRKS